MSTLHRERMSFEEWEVLPNNRIRIPDVSVVERPPSGGCRIAEPPVIVAEVLSPGTRGQDLVTKSHEDAAAGIGQYWLLDPDGRTLDVFELIEGGWSPVLQLTEAAPVGSVRVGDNGVVEADLSVLLDY